MAVFRMLTQAEADALLAAEEAERRARERERMRRKRERRRAARSAEPPRRRPLSRHTPYRRQPYWTRERVVEGLRRFWRDQGRVVTDTSEWHGLTKGTGYQATRPYPSTYAVLKHWSTMREAWMAAGVLVDRSHEEWSELEDWYAREAAGILPLDEIGRDLRRSGAAVKRRLYDMGIVCRCRPDLWSISRLQRMAGPVVAAAVRSAIRRGQLPTVYGSQCIYLDPADLPLVHEIRWEATPDELEQAIRRALVARIAGILEARLCRR